MRRPSNYEQRGGELDVMMTPMIDVVFQLIIFFVCTASFQQVEHVLPSSLSAAAGSTPSDQNGPPPEADFDRVVVRIQWVEGRPSWRINDTPAESLDQLRRRLDQIAKIKSDAPVVLHPDQQTPIGSVIDVYDISRLVGFEKVQFAATGDV